MGLVLHVAGTAELILAVVVVAGNTAVMAGPEWLLLSINLYIQYR
jgi:hypothetical protein